MDSTSPIYWATVLYTVFLWAAAILCTFYCVKAIGAQRAIRSNPILLSLYIAINIQLFLSVFWFVLYIFSYGGALYDFVDAVDELAVQAVSYLVMARFIQTMQFLNVRLAAQKVLYAICIVLFGASVVGTAAAWISAPGGDVDKDDRLSFYLFVSAFVCLVSLLSVLLFMTLAWIRVLGKCFCVYQKLLTLFSLSELVAYSLSAVWHCKVLDSRYDGVMAILWSIFGDAVPAAVICAFIAPAGRQKAGGKDQRSVSVPIVTRPINEDDSGDSSV